MPVELLYKQQLRTFDLLKHSRISTTGGLKKTNTLWAWKCKSWKWRSGSLCGHTSKYLIYSLMHKKTEKSISRFFVYKKFKKQFYFFTCILPGYVFNESPKEFWKNSNFENIRANFISRCQNSLWQNSPEIIHFQAWKKESFN